MPSKPLTFAKRAGMVGFPKPERHTNAFSAFQRQGKDLPAYAVKLTPYSAEDLTIEGRIATSSIREDWRLLRAGERRDPALFIFPNP